MQITRETVILFYELILGRKPESEDVIRAKMSCTSLHELANEFFKSSEYIERTGDNFLFTPTPYCGFIGSDISLLQKYENTATTSEPGFITDWLGGRHRIEDLPHLQNRDGDRVKGIPIPDDTFHAEAIEYVGLLLSIEAAKGSYTIDELGAGWAPWLVSAGLCCRHRGIKNVNLIGVEGQSNKIPLIIRHLQKNELAGEFTDMSSRRDGVYSKIYDGVITKDGEDMEFPIVGIEHYGASILDAMPKGGKTIKKKGYSLDQIINNYNYIDLIHIDIQGYELDLIISTIDLLKKKARYLLIGTHSRYIEGCLFELLHEHSFTLLREKPCIFHYNNEVSNFVSMTTKDGTQIWINNNI